MENEIRQQDGGNQKIILFAIGVLVGAVIATSAFLICVKTIGSNDNGGSSMQGGPGGTPPEMPSGSNSSNGQNGTPPEMPSGSSESGGQSGQSGTPPEMPGNSNSNSSNSGNS
jgi:hypothetical protein